MGSKKKIVDNGKILFETAAGRVLNDLCEVMEEYIKDPKKYPIKGLSAWIPPEKTKTRKKKKTKKSKR